MIKELIFLLEVNSNIKVSKDYFGRYFRNVSFLDTAYFQDIVSH